jgi:hypothetical protein
MANEPALRKKSLNRDMPAYNDIMPAGDSLFNIRDFELQQIVIGLYLEKNDALQILRYVHGLYDDDAGEQRFTNVSLNTIKDIINKYRDDTSLFVDQNPDILEKRLDLIIRNVQSLDKVEKAQWELYNSLAGDNAKSKVATLANIQKTIMEKAKLQQLLGNDTDTRRHLDEAKEANHMLVIMIRDVTERCPECKKRLDQYLKRNMSVSI